MKRSPLRRKSALKKTPLKRMSSEKSHWTQKYRDSLDSFGPFVRCAHSGLRMHRSECDPHHMFGRQGQYLLCYVWVSKWFHRMIHDHGTQSRALGWLQKPYSGGQYDPSEPRPWKPEFESHFPEKYRRLAS